jgi:hypothetical protein
MELLPCLVIKKVVLPVTLRTSVLTRKQLVIDGDVVKYLEELSDKGCMESEVKLYIV